MNSNPNVPYEALDPDTILSAIESVGYICDGSLHALNSYENRVYQVGIENALPIIAKFYRPQRWSNEAILEEHQFALELMEHEIPVVAPLQNNNETLHHFKNFRFTLFPRWGGRALELDSLQQLEWMGRFIGRMHAISSCRPFQHRQQLSVKTFGHDAYQFIIQHDFLPDYLRDNYCNMVEIALQKIEQRFQLVDARNNIRLHGDIHAGNVLWNDAGPHIVDLDDCMMGPAIQDIWMLLSGDEHQISIEIEHILRGYREFHDFNSQELILIEALRTLRMLHYSAWIARRWTDPAFPASFPWFNTPQYWQQQLQNLAEQVSLLDEMPEQPYFES